MIAIDNLICKNKNNITCSKIENGIMGRIKEGLKLKSHASDGRVKTRDLTPVLCP